MTWDDAITQSVGYLLGSFAIGYGTAYLVTAFKKFTELL